MAPFYPDNGGSTCYKISVTIYQITWCHTTYTIYIKMTIPKTFKLLEKKNKNSYLHVINIQNTHFWKYSSPPLPGNEILNWEFKYMQTIA